jgi:hypothetical protein
MIVSRSGLRPVVQQHIEQRPVNLDVAVVVNKTQLSKLGHEEIDVGAASADHLRERLLAYFRYDRLRPIFLPVIRQNQKQPRQTFFGRVEQLVDQAFECFVPSDRKGKARKTPYLRGAREPRPPSPWPGAFRISQSALL